MGRKAAAISAGVHRKVGAKRRHRLARPTSPARAAHASGRRGTLSVDRDIRVGPVGPTIGAPRVLDDFPTLLPVLDRELEVIETYLGASLDELLGSID